MASRLAVKLPAEMFSFGTLMHIEYVQDNYTPADTVLTALSIDMTAARPIIIRQPGRHGTLPVLLICLLVAIASLTLLVIFRPPLWAMMLLVAMAGAATPPIQPTVHTLYPKLMPQYLVTPLFSPDAVLREII